MKERQWRVQRTSLQQSHSQMRWDLAYQCLLKWEQTLKTKPQQEARDESSHLRPCINTGTGRDTDS
jgi:hypothetical protein